LDTFASRQTPKNPPARRASSAHTYRLLIFKDHSLGSSAFFASVIKREANYEGPPPPPSSTFEKLFFWAAELNPGLTQISSERWDF
ncbi:hypothetical protein, partial [Paraburkholderia sp. GAS348]|uniref:hypothetical protein n=1 Tax=Paraburkholderia sp. GAS348 TaxID=3035132 RepID=UPI003D205E90